MPRFKSPCTPECDRRCVGCSVTCPKWARYAEARDARYRENERHAQLLAYTFDSVTRHSHGRPVVDNKRRTYS